MSTLRLADGAAASRVRLPALVRAALVPLAILAAALLFRGIAFLQAVIDTDEGLYIVQAEQWLRGAWPLVAVWDMHPIGAPAIYAGVFALFGEGVLPIRWLGVACVALTGWAIYGLVRAAGGARRIALAAGLLYPPGTVVMFGLATNTEILFAPLVVAAMALGVRGAARPAEPPGFGVIALAGLAIGCAIAIKPVVVPEGCLVFALLVFPALWRGALTWGRACALAAAYAALCLLPSAGFALAYALRGAFEAWLDGSVLAPFRYSTERLPLDEALHRVQTAGLVLLWPLGLALLAWRVWLRRGGPAGLLARIGLLWAGCAAIAILGPGFFYPHYFLIALPVLSVLSALGLWHMAGIAGRGRRRAAFAVLVALLAVGTWRQEAVVRLGRGFGLWKPDPVVEVANAVRARLRPGEAIYVANYHPVVYALTDAELPTRFVFPAQITGNFTTVAGIDTDQELRRILATRPRLVLVDRGWWFHLRPSAAAILTEVLSRDFELETTVAEERGPIEFWRPKPG